MQHKSHSGSLVVHTRPSSRRQLYMQQSVDTLLSITTALLLVFSCWSAIGQVDCTNPKGGSAEPNCGVDGRSRNGARKRHTAIPGDQWQLLIAWWNSSHGRFTTPPQQWGLREGMSLDQHFLTGLTILTLILHFRRCSWGHALLAQR